MGRAPIQHEMECATNFRIALTVAFGKPPFAALIRARIHESAVSRVARAYGGRLADAFLEALQNSRRAGATRVRIAVRQSVPHGRCQSKSA